MSIKARYTVQKGFEVEILFTPRNIFVKAWAKNGLYINFKVEEVRLMDEKYTAVLKPVGYRKTPWFKTREFKKGIKLENIVIPERYKAVMIEMLSTESNFSEELAKGSGRSKNRLPAEEYVLPILEALAELGGKGKSKKILDRVFEKVKYKLTDEDKMLTKDNQYFWISYAQRACQKLKKRGYIKMKSRTGYLELKEEGWKYLKDLKSLKEMKQLTLWT